MVEDIVLSAAIKQTSLLIAGDTVPTKSNANLFSEGVVDALVDDGILRLLRDSSYLILNLEVPLANRESPIEKAGPALVAPTNTVYGLQRLGVDAVCLANNHIMDQGPLGLESTFSALEGAGIKYFGAGNRLADAQAPISIEIGKKRIGIYACAEHEFSIAGNDSPGANPFNPLSSLGSIRDLKSGCDVVVVLYHGGKEHYRYPSPLLRERCRAIVDSGADVVVCQHSHCVGCEEKWHDGTIVYGQGNFLFDRQDSEFWATGLLIEVDIEDGTKVIYHPVVKDGGSVRLANKEENDGIMRAFWERSEKIKSPGFVEAEYKSFARAYLRNYLSAVVPGARTLLFRALNKICGGRLVEKMFGKKPLISLQNFIECEAHSELFLTGIRAMIDEGKNSRVQ